MTRRLFLIGACCAAIALGAFAARDSVYSLYSLLLANWNSDLREGFVSYRHLVRQLNPEELAASSKIIQADGPYRLWRSRIGDFWMTQDDDIRVLAEMAAIIEGNTYQYRGRGVQPGDVVIDCGAHLGSFVRRSLQSGASLVVAIEPSSQKIECLRRTFGAEIAAGKVRLVQLAIWNADDELWLAGSPTLTNTLTRTDRPPGRDGEWVDVTTLDKIVAAQQLERVDFVKMDIEGAEVKALEGSKETIRRFRPFLAIAVEHTDDLAQNARNVIRAVDGFHLGYQHGFGRYGKPRKRTAYTPWEIFFFVETAAPSAAH